MPLGNLQTRINSAFLDFIMRVAVWQCTCLQPLYPSGLRRKELNTMWKPTNQPSTPETKTPSTEKPATTTTTSAPNTASNTYTTSEPTPVAAPRNALMSTTEQATIGKSLVIKGEVTGSESLYIDGRVEGSINLPGNRVTVV